MPLNRRGSVSARLSVWFSAVSAARKDARSLEKTSMPPASKERNASSPSTTCNDARRLEPASVSTREPLGKSNAARVWRPASLASGARQCKRPAIIQVKDQPEVVLYADCYALAYSSQFADFAAFGVFKWGLRGSQEEGALQPDALEGLTYYARFQRGDVGGDVWQFR